MNEAAALNLKILHQYIFRQVATTLGITVMVFALVLLLGEIVREALGWFVAGKVSPAIIIKGVACLTPTILVYALPFGMLAAVLIVFGRFSADHELTAAKSGGISLVDLSFPVVLLSVALAAFCVWLNLEAAPRAQAAYETLLRGVAEEMQSELLVEKRFNVFGDFIIYAERIRRGKLRHVTLWILEDGKIQRDIYAESGFFEIHREEGYLLVVLRDLKASQKLGSKERAARVGEYEHRFPIKGHNEGRNRLRLNEMSFRQLKEEISRIEREFGNALETGLKASRLDRYTEPVLVQLNTQFALSFACFSFTLVGVPLGVRAHRKETSIGIALSIILVLLFYSFIVLGKSLANRPEYAPHLLVWLPNFFFQGIGIVMIWRGNHGIGH